MKNNQEKVLAVLLTQDHGSVFELLLKINREWFDDGFNRMVYDAVVELNSKGEVSNMLTVMEHLRKGKKFEPNHAVRLSRISNDAEWRLPHISVLLGALDQDYKRREVNNFITHTQRQIADDTFMVDDFLDRQDKVREVLSGTIDKQISNSDIVNEIIIDHDEAKTGKFPGVSMPFPQLRENILLDPVDLMIIGARPGMGKSVFAVSYACNKAFIDNEPVSIFTLEMSAKQYMRRIIAFGTGIDSKKIRMGKCTDQEIELIRSFREREELKNIIIHEGPHSARDITRKITKDKHEDGVKSFVVDYLQKVIPSRGKTEFERTTANSNDIKALVQSIKIPCIAFAQIKRPEPGAKVRRPGMSNLRGSGDMEQDASTIGFLHRWDYYGIKQDPDGNPTNGSGEFLLSKYREGDTNEIFKFSVDNTVSKWSTYNPIETPTTEDNELPF